MNRVPLLVAALFAAAIAVPTAVEAQSDSGCLTRADAASLAARRSPLDSVMFRMGDQEVKICYGRPSARNRQMIGGGAVPFGRLWRTGANEPTIIRTPVALSIAGVRIPAGTFAIYTVPGEEEWQIILNRSYSQWGQEGQYTAEVEAQEVGRGSAPSERLEDHVETFTIRVDSGRMYMEWENTRVVIPIARG
jgi:hypothetical protein